jgi:imidazolonepropionase-like amidohydrolase
VIVLEGAQVLTMHPGQPTSWQVTDLAVQDGRIVALGAGVDPAGAVRYDLSGHYIVPGLIDMHCHLTYSGETVEEQLLQTIQERSMHAVHNAGVTLRSGVTTCRDPGAIDHIDIALRDAMAAGRVEGPNLRTAGRMIAMTGGHGWFIGVEGDGPEEIRKLVRTEIKARADWIKFMASGGFAEPHENPEAVQLDQDEMAAGVHEARKAGRKTTAHAHPAQAMKNAILAGVDSLEHASFPDSECIDLLLERGVAICPTFRIYYQMKEHGLEVGLRAAVVDTTRRLWDRKVECFQRCLQAGVRVVAGTDSGSPGGYHGDLAQELELFVRFGMPAHDALRAATYDAAALLGMEAEVGSLALGKRADLVVLADDPLRDPGALRSRLAVMKDGRFVPGGAREGQTTLPPAAGHLV